MGRITPDPPRSRRAIAFGEISLDDLADLIEAERVQGRGVRVQLGGVVGLVSELEVRTERSAFEVTTYGDEDRQYVQGSARQTVDITIFVGDLDVARIGISSFRESLMTGTPIEIDEDLAGGRLRGTFFVRSIEIEERITSSFTMLRMRLVATAPVQWLPLTPARSILEPARKPARAISLGRLEDEP